MFDKSKLLEIENNFWKSGTKFYDKNLADEVLFVLPGMTLDRNEGVDAVNQQPRWDYIALESVKLVELNEDTVLLSYQAQAKRGDSPLYHANVSSLYKFEGKTPKLLFHQQTPDPQN